MSKARLAWWLVCLLWAEFIIGILTYKHLEPPVSEDKPDPVQVTIEEESVSYAPLNAVAVDPLQTEKEYIAKTIWGEARGCDREGQKAVAWCILDRYDDGRFGNSIIEVVTARNQFQGYRESNPITAEQMDVADEVVEGWLRGEQSPGYLYFYGDGKENHFTEEWYGGGKE